MKLLFPGFPRTSEMSLYRANLQSDRVKTCCCICGHNQCGLEVRLEQGTVKEIAGDADDPVTQARFVPKRSPPCNFSPIPDACKLRWFVPEKEATAIGERRRGTKL